MNNNGQWQCGTYADEIVRTKQMRFVVVSVFFLNDYFLLQVRKLQDRICTLENNYCCRQENISAMCMYCRFLSQSKF